jgi:hypothetical protein
VLSVSLSGAPGGRVVSTPAGIDCPTTCSMTAPEGASFTLNAEPADGVELSGWGGMCAGIGGCSVTLNADADVSAGFVPVPLPAICNVLAPAALPPATQSTLASVDSCTPGLSTDDGKLALIGFGNASRSTAIVDVFRRAQASLRIDSMQSNASMDFAAQPSNFVQIVRTPVSSDGSTPGGPSQELKVSAFDENVVASGSSFEGRLVMAGVPSGGVVLAGAILTLAPGGVAATRQQLCMLRTTGAIQWCTDRAAQGPVYGTGVDENGRTLVITGGAAQGTVTAQWFDAAGRALTGEFVLIESFTAGQNTWFEARPLISGGLVVRRMDQLNDPAGHPYRTAQWLFAVDAGSDTVRPAPAWLQPDTDIAIARKGQGYALLPMGKPSAPCEQTVRMVAADGTRCQTFTLPLAPGSCRTEDVGLGRDGTVVEIVPRELRPAGTCSWVFWPAALQ